MDEGRSAMPAGLVGQEERKPAENGPASYDVFVDLSDHSCDEAFLRAHLDRLAYDAGLAGVAGRLTLAVAPMKVALRSAGGLEVEVVTHRAPVDALARAIRLAARARRHLVVLIGPVAPGSEAIAELIAGFDEDPMFGTIQPRFAEDTTDLIWPLPGGDERGAIAPTTFRASLRHLPSEVVTPELPACCLVLRWALLIGVEPADQPGRSLSGGLLHLLAQARRLGFRNLVRNRVVVATSLGYDDIYPAPPVEEVEALRATDLYAAGAAVELAHLSQRRAEALLAAAGPDAQGRFDLLLDCRGMPALHNGTSMCILGLLDGFAALDANWTIHVLASAGALEFHGLARRYPRFRHLTDAPHGTFAAAVLLSQPWEIAHVAELHRHAFATAFLMLDAIPWDIYPGRTGMEATWHFIAQHADALFYISHFTQARFNKRFSVAAGVAETVTHLSLAEADHKSSSEAVEPIPTPILVFGNGFDHKHLHPTVELICDAFPFHAITAIGLAQAPRRNVTAVGSGQTSRERLLGLIAGAGVIVFPSFYEGFGLPVVEGLAYDRTVLVRRSALWDEIAAHSRLPGRLYAFDDPASLAEGIGKALAGLPLDTLPSGTALAEGEAPANWPACARRISAMLAKLLSGPRLDHWWARERALRILQP